MNLELSIVTCDRRQFGKTNYFGRTWNSLLAAGVLDLGDSNIRIFDAGPEGTWAEELRKLTGCAVVSWDGPGPLPLSPNGHWAMEWLTTRTGPGIFMQDDVEVKACLVSRLSTWLSEVAPRADTYVFGAQYWWTRYPENIQRGWAMYAPEQFYGLWAMVFLPRTLELYLASEERRGADAQGSCDDLWFAKWCKRTEHTICAHCPNLARHIGLESTGGRVHHEMQF